MRDSNGKIVSGIPNADLAFYLQFLAVFQTCSKHRMRFSGQAVVCLMIFLKVLCYGETSHLGGEVGGVWLL